MYISSVNSSAPTPASSAKARASKNVGTATRAASIAVLSNSPSLVNTAFKALPPKFLIVFPAFVKSKSFPGIKFLTCSHAEGPSVTALADVSARDVGGPSV